MQLSNREQVGRILDEVNDGLRPFLEPLLASRFGAGWPDVVRERKSARIDRDPLADVAATLAIMDRFWRELFANGPLTRMERSLVIELLEWRHRWAHAEPLPDADVSRVRLSADRLLGAIVRPLDSGPARIRIVDPPPTQAVSAPDSGFHIGPVVASLAEPESEPTLEDAQRPMSNWRLVVRAHYRTPNYGVPDSVRGLLVDQELDVQAVLAEIVNGVVDAGRSGGLIKGDRISPDQVLLPPEANSDLTILAFRDLELRGLLELERLGVAVWRVR